MDRPTREPENQRRVFCGDISICGDIARQFLSVNLKCILLRVIGLENCILVHFVSVLVSELS